MSIHPASNSDDGGTQQSPKAAFLAWKHSMASAGLLSPEPIQNKGKVPQNVCGVSLGWLLKFADSLESMETVGEDTQSIVSKVILPVTRWNLNRFRLWDFIPMQYCGKPHYYLVHTWSDDFKTMLHNLKTFLEKQVTHQAQLAAEKSGGDDFKPRTIPIPVEDITYIWMDVVVVNQHVISGMPLELADVREAITSTARGSIVALDPNLNLLNRVWCMWEVSMGPHGLP